MPVADQTLEILMSELDPAAMQVFYKSEELSNFAQASDLSGISSLFPGAILDGFLFDPCGYSVNGMMDEHYFTIHVTPQEQFSFASFETDVPMVSILRERERESEEEEEEEERNRENRSLSFLFFLKKIYFGKVLLLFLSHTHTHTLPLYLFWHRRTTLISLIACFVSSSPVAPR